MIQSRISQLNEKIYHHYYLVNFLNLDVIRIECSNQCFGYLWNGLICVRQSQLMLIQYNRLLTWVCK